MLLDPFRLAEKAELLPDYLPERGSRKGGRKYSLRKRPYWIRRPLLRFQINPQFRDSKYTFYPYLK
jgi:hypothetical protein